MSWQIKDKSGKIVKAEVETLEYNGTWLGERYLTLTVESPTPIDFTVGDYLEYRGERFEINYDPTVIKSAPSGVQGDAFKYDNIKLNSYSDELTRCDFLDVVLADNKIHYTTLPNFGFYAETVKDLADRIQANLNRLYPGLWTVECHPEYAEKTGVALTASNIKVWDAMQFIVNEFGCNFSIKGRHITIGLAGTPVSQVFYYGKGKGLYELEKTADTDQQIVTRLRAYGSTRNLPLRHYSNIGMKVAMKIIARDFSYDKDADGNDLKVGELRFRLEGKSESPISATVTVKINNKEYQAEYVYKNDTTVKYDDVYYIKNVTEEEVATIQVGDMAYIISGVSFNLFNPKYLDASDALLPNDMAITNLMLPGFPKKSLRQYETKSELKPLCSDDAQDPYIDSANKETIGLRESTVIFDGSDDKEEIYPTIEGITREQLIAAGGTTISTYYLDELLQSNLVTDNGLSVPSGDEQKPQTENFVVFLKDIGFNLWDYRASDTPKISFKSGKLGGREFEIIKCEWVDGRGYKLTCNRLYDDDVQKWFPYNDYNASAGDKFVLLEINMPELYINIASQRLLEAAREYLAKNDYSRSTHTPKIDEIMMARQHDQAMQSNGLITSLHDTITEGMKLLFVDDDLGIDASIFIETLTIREDVNSIPKYEVTLKEEKTVGTIQKIQNQIDSIISGKLGKNNGNNAGYSAQDIREFVYTYGKERFLSKQEPDTAAKLICFLEGAEFGTFVKGYGGAQIDASGDAEVGALTVRDSAEVGTELAVGKKLTIGEYIPGAIGGTFYVDSRGEAHIETATITVNKKMTVKEVEIQEQTWVGGAQINSPASMRCHSVETIEGGWRCYFLAEDDEAEIKNEFQVGDLARCQIYNLVDTQAQQTSQRATADETTAGWEYGEGWRYGYGWRQGGIESEAITNRYYWRKVIGVSQSPVTINGDSLHYIDLSSKEGEFDPDSTSEPMSGDRIITVGNDTDSTRANVIIASSYGEGSPYLYQYQGINTFSLSSDKLKTRISPYGNKFTGQFYVEAGGSSPESLTEYIKNNIPEQDTIYSLRTSAKEVLVYHRTDSNGNLITSFTNNPISCFVDENVGTKSYKSYNCNSLPANVEVRYRTTKYDSVLGVYSNSTIVKYTGQSLYTTEDMRYIEFYLYINGRSTSSVQVVVHSDSSNLDAEYRASLEVTEQAITAQATKTSALESRTSQLQITANQLSTKVGRVSANLVPIGTHTWEAYHESLILTNQPEYGGFVAEQDTHYKYPAVSLPSDTDVPEDEIFPQWHSVRCKIDSSKFKPDTDYILSADIWFQDEVEESVITQNKLAFRVGITNISQQIALCPFQPPKEKYQTYNSADPIPMTFQLHTAKTIPTGQMYIYFVFQDWADRVDPVRFECDYIKLEEGTIATSWVPADKDLESAIEQQAGQIAMSVKVDGEERAGLTLDEQEGITLQADKVKILNGNVLAAMFINGILNADLLEVTKLATKADGRTRVTIGEFNDAFIRFYHSDGVTVALKLGLDYVSLNSGISSASDTSNEGLATTAIENGTITITPSLTNAKPCVAQVFDEDGKLTWVLFLTGPVTPDTQPYSWRSYSLTPASAATTAAINSKQTLKSVEYWQFKATGSNAVEPYKNYNNYLFTKKISDSEFNSSPSAYFVPNGTYYAPEPQMELASISGATTVWKRKVYTITNGVLKQGTSITVN